MANSGNGPATLVVGSKGMIGGALVKQQRQTGRRVIGADLGENSSDGEYISINLADDLSDWQPPCPVQLVYLCAAVSKLEECRQDPKGSSQINIRSTVKLADILRKQGAFVVFLSSNQVFDGTNLLANPDLPFSPLTEYGRQKAETERLLRQHIESTAIVRLTKVLGPNSIIWSWAASLLAGKPITPFKDMYLAPVPLDTVITVLNLIGNLKLSGIWQISGERDISYADAALWGAKVLGVDSGLLEPVFIAESRLELEANPKNTTLNSDRLPKQLGIVPPSIRWTIERAFKKAQSLLKPSIGKIDHLR
jgi:dTDP-4-dehydrorhamnose reductase